MTDHHCAALRLMADAIDQQRVLMGQLSEAMRTLADTPDETQLNLTKAARELGVSRAIVRNAIRNGIVKAERYGARCWRVSRGELDKLRKLRATA